MCWYLEHLLNGQRSVSAGFTNQRVGRLFVNLKSLVVMKRLRTQRKNLHHGIQLASQTFQGFVATKFLYTPQPT